MKTYYVRDDNSEFTSVRAKSRVDAVVQFLMETYTFEQTMGLDFGNMTVFVERPGKPAIPMRHSNVFGGWVVKKAPAPVVEEVSMSMLVRKPEEASA